MTVAAVLKHKGNDVISVDPTTTVAEIAGIIAARRIGAVLVLDAERRPVGIVSERDVVKALAATTSDIRSMTAEQLMTRELVTATPQTSVDDAMVLMDKGYFRHLPVMDGGKLVGLISIRDVVRHRIMVHEHEVESLKAYVARAM